jgi:hypothetical protein
MNDPEDESVHNSNPNEPMATGSKRNLKRNRQDLDGIGESTNDLEETPLDISTDVPGRLKRHKK